MSLGTHFDAIRSTAEAMIDHFETDWRSSYGDPDGTLHQLALRGTTRHALEQIDAVDRKRAEKGHPPQENFVRDLLWELACRGAVIFVQDNGAASRGIRVSLPDQNVWFVIPVGDPTIEVCSKYSQAPMPMKVDMSKTVDVRGPGWDHLMLLLGEVVELE